jgi:cation transport ATPase
VEDARALKPGLLHIVDRVLQVYTPTVLTISALAFLGWVFGPLAFGGDPDLQRAVVEAALERGLDFPDVADFQAESGRGVTAHIDGETVRVGSPAFLSAAGIALDTLQERIDAAEKHGHTVIVVARDRDLRELAVAAPGDVFRGGGERGTIIVVPLQWNNRDMKSANTGEVRCHAA